MHYVGTVIGSSEARDSRFDTENGSVGTPRHPLALVVGSPGGNGDAPERRVVAPGRPQPCAGPPLVRAELCVRSSRQIHFYSCVPAIPSLPDESDPPSRKIGTPLANLTGSRGSPYPNCKIDPLSQLAISSGASRTRSSTTCGMNRHRGRLPPSIRSSCSSRRRARRSWK